MKKYTAPQAQVISFDNNYVMTAKQNKSWQIGNGCEYTSLTDSGVSDR